MDFVVFAALLILSKTTLQRAMLTTFLVYAILIQLSGSALEWVGDMHFLMFQTARMVNQIDFGWWLNEL